MLRPLHWGRGEALTTVNFSGTLENFYGETTEGQMVPVEVDHSAGEDGVTFALAEPPRFAEAPGVAFLVDASYTDGGKFRVMALRTDDVGGGLSGGAGDLDYSGTRRGVAE